MNEQANPDLSQPAVQIDSIDQQLLTLLNQRARGRARARSKSAKARPFFRP